MHYDKTERRAFADAEVESLDAATLEGCERKELDGRFYYYTRYGSPLAFVRPLELLGTAGITDLGGRRLIDFGFGSIGQLRMMAACGAQVVGIEVDPLLAALYSDPADTAVAETGNGGSNGRIDLQFGRFPADDELTSALGGGYDVFVSKNTLKRGYIHPEHPVDPARLVHLDVDDERFVRAVYDLLAPGGLMLIYNLYPPQAEAVEDYRPWADGRSPFSRELFERVGFEVIAFDRDDSDAARRMGRLLGWDEQMQLDRDLFGMYTLVRKPQNRRPRKK